MKIAPRRPFGQNYAWVVAGVTFLALLAAAGLRSAPGVLMTPLHDSFGWDRATLSAAAAIGIFLYGLVGPFAAALMQTLGLKPVHDRRAHGQRHRPAAQARQHPPRWRPGGRRTR